MVAPHMMLPDLDVLDREALKALVVQTHSQLRIKDEQLQLRTAEIEHLQLLIAKLQRLQFGRKSEKLNRQIEQLELRLEELQTHQGETTEQQESPAAAPPATSATPAAKPARRPLPEHLPRKTKRHEPRQKACPDCGGGLQKAGEDVSEMLEYIPAQFIVIQHVRPKFSCPCCERLVQAEAPSRPIARGLAGPGLLAHVIVSKYADHLP